MPCSPRPRRRHPPAPSAAAPAPDATVGDPASAIYGSETLDLADDWGTASACIELGDVTECFDTEADLLAAHAEARGVARSIGVTEGRRRQLGHVLVVAAACTTATRTAAAILYLNTRGVTHNLADFGFDNVTSSYRVGGCSASLFSSPTWAARVYPGYTGAVGAVADDGRRMEQRRLQRLHLLILSASPQGLADNDGSRPDGDEADQQRAGVEQHRPSRCRS